MMLDEPRGASPLPTSTSRLAVFSVLTALPCLPVLSGLGGVLFGLLALAQIRATSSLEGSSLAWMGILGGAMNLVVCATLGLHVLSLRQQVDGAADQFFSAWGQSEQAGEDAAAAGLRAEMHRAGAGDALLRQIQERLGTMSGVAGREHFGYGVDVKGGLHEKVSAIYPVKNARGMPFEATLRFSTVDEVRVVGFQLSAPGLHGQTSIQGGVVPDLSAYDGPSDHPRGHMKSFSK